MTADLFAVPGEIIPDFTRDRWGRPMITPAGGGKPVPYGRPSSFGKKLEDTYGLEMWQRRMVTVGLARTPSLVARAATIPGDPKAWTKAQKDELNAIADEAQVSAKANQAADIGTSLHKMKELVDLGHDVSHLPEPYASDIAAYRAGMAAHGFIVKPEYVECRMVCDELKLAGTCDNILERGGHAIADLKTGASIEAAALGYAVQCAIYAHSDLINVVTGERTPIPNLSKNVAFIMHLPAGEATFTLYEVDIAAGWEAALVCAQIDGWRKRKGLLQIVRPAGDSPETTGDEPQAAPTVVDRRLERIANLRERCRTIVTMSASAADMLRLNLGIAGLDLTVPGLSLADIDAATMIVEAAEREASAPFNDLTPEADPGRRVPGMPQPAA